MDQQTSPNEQPRVIREPAIPLSQLLSFFVRSTQDGDLDEATRSFAAKCAVLANHLVATNFRQLQFMKSVANRFATNEKLSAELTQHMAALASKTAPPMTQDPPGEVAPHPVVDTNEAPSSGDPIQDEAEALEQQEIQRADEEVSRLASAQPKRAANKPAPRAKTARPQ